MKGFSPFTAKKRFKRTLNPFDKHHKVDNMYGYKERKKIVKDKHRRQESGIGNDKQIPPETPMKQKLSNWEIYQYYKNKEHITDADDEMKARQEATIPVNTEPVYGTAPLPGIGRMKGVFDAFSKIAKHRSKMNKLIEADLIKKGYRIMPTKSSGAAKGVRESYKKLKKK